jgi:hypothetical protein
MVLRMITSNCATAFIGNTLRVRIDFAVNSEHMPLTDLGIVVDDLGEFVWTMVSED